MTGIVVTQLAGLWRVLGVALAAASGLAACATTPPSSSLMPEGRVAMPPAGLLDLCRRAPEICGRGEGHEPVLILAASETPLDDISSVATGATPADPVSSTGGAKMTAPDAALLAARSRAEHDEAPRQEAIASDGDEALAGLGAKSGLAVAEAEPAEPAALEVPLTAGPELFTLLNRVNQSINQAIRPRDDIDQYGVEEFWALPLSMAPDGQARQAQGDCEDYALEKRLALIAAGVPDEAMFLAVGHSIATGRHAVLVVRTDQGDYVLDNMTPYILPWNQTGYVWLSRQTPGDLLSWQHMAQLTG